MTDERRRWHVRKELSIGDILALAGFIGMLLVSYFSLDKRITLLEVDAAEVHDVLKRMDEKLDHLMEGTKP